MHLLTYNYKKMLKVKKKWCRMNHLFSILLTLCIHLYGNQNRSSTCLYPHHMHPWVQWFVTRHLIQERPKNAKHAPTQYLLTVRQKKKRQSCPIHRTGRMTVPPWPNPSLPLMWRRACRPFPRWAQRPAFFSMRPASWPRRCTGPTGRCVVVGSLRAIDLPFK